MRKNRLFVLRVHHASTIWPMVLLVVAQRLENAQLEFTQVASIKTVRAGTLGSRWKIMAFTLGKLRDSLGDKVLFCSVHGSCY